MDLETADDEELIVLVAEGNSRAFELLMRRNLRHVLVLAQGVLGNASDADEIAQEAFMRVWSHAPLWQPGRARFSTWLHRIVLNLCLDRRRKPSHVGIDGVVDRLEDTAESPPVRISRDEDRRAVTTAMMRLSERHRAALVLFYFEDLSTREAAECLEIKANAFEQLLLRARRALKIQLVRLGGLPEGEG